jgi:hypothetical protein
MCIAYGSKDEVRRCLATWWCAILDMCMCMWVLCERLRKEMGAKY